LFSPDREHLHHKLLDRGFTQRQVVYVLYAVSIVSAIAGMLMTTGNDYVFKASCIALVGIIATGVGAIGYVEFVEIARIFHRVTEQRRVISNDVALRKLAGRIRNARCLGEVQSEVRGTFVKMEFDGCDLVLMPSFNNRVHCRETSKTASWGYGIRTHAQVLQCWSMEIDLFSERFGKLGWLRLSRRMDRGSLLFDANVLVSELQPALLVALEHCVIGECQQVKEESVPSHRSVGLELEAPAHSYSVQASTLTG
jgi:hypothetical protein